MDLHVPHAPLALLEEIMVQETKHANHGKMFARLGNIQILENVENVLPVNKESKMGLRVSYAPMVLLGGIMVQETKHANHGKMFARLLNTL